MAENLIRHIYTPALTKLHLFVAHCLLTYANRYDEYIPSG